ncbi:hypothetical protein BGP_5407 [Beggiatoa sp. PS]|nr:hypothetical protein BGP_5407 [Beggiatoa sp. PS]
MDSKKLKASLWTPTNSKLRFGLQQTQSFALDSNKFKALLWTPTNSKLRFGLHTNVLESKAKLWILKFIHVFDSRQNSPVVWFQQYFYQWLT